MRFKRIVSLFLTAVFLLLFSIPASASSVVYSDTLSFETAITEYANSTIATYLRVSEQFNAIHTYELTQGIISQNGTDPHSRTFFVFENGQNIGYLTATYQNDSYASCFVPTPIAELDAIVMNHIPITLYCYESCCCLIYDGTHILLEGFEKEHPVHAIADIQSTTTLTLTRVNIPINTPRGSEVEYYLDVPVVRNTSDPDGHTDNDGKPLGLCWAACVASIGAFKTGQSLSATDIYYWAKNNLSVERYDYPIGVEPFIIGTLNEKYGLSYSLTSSALSADAVWNSIFNLESPVYMSITDAAGNYGHGVVISGMTYGSTVVYEVMDPNKPTYAYISTTSSSTSIYYVTTYCTYTIWRRSYHD